MKEPRIEPVGAVEGLNDPVVDDAAVRPEPEIVSVNSKAASGNKAAKTLFILACSAVLIGLLAWLGQSYLNTWKQSAKSPKREFGVEVDPMNPEASRAAVAKVGAATGKPPPQPAPLPATPPGPSDNDGVRAIRGADGKVMTDPQGRALGVDPTGKVVPVPAIAALPGPAGATPAAAPPPPSRYGGSLFVDKAILSAAAANAAPTGYQGTSGTPAAGAPAAAGTANTVPQLELLKSLLTAAGQRTGGSPGAPGSAGGSPSAPAPSVSPYAGQPAEPFPAGNAPLSMGGPTSSAASGMTTVANTQANTRTPMVQARMLPDQNLIIPKGRQAGCVLTTRIDDQLPGYTSCTLLDDLYSDNGKTLLLEHGSDIWGEYGTIGQPGLSRIAVNWVRIKTRDGITVDLSSPGTDALGGSGLPGHYNPRWVERIGAAVLLSLVKDVTAAVINSQTKSGGTTVSVAPPGQSTIGGTSNIADQVVRETLRVRPNVTIAEGTRISIYVNRDLDFRPVYELRRAANVAQAAP